MYKMSYDSNPHLPNKEEEQVIDFLRLLFMLVILIIMAKFTIAHADEFTYFNSDIDYWQEQGKSQVVKPQKKQTPVKKPFDWNKYLDPTNEEFFKEGDYTPPAPFMELVRNPTDQNLNLWFSYMDKKNQLRARLVTKMEDYLAKKRGNLDQAAINELQQKIGEMKTEEVKDIKRYRFRYYFDSTCPHCQKMFATMNELLSMGFYVEARQVDDRKFRAKFPFTILKAGKEELKKFKVKSVPFLLIGDLKEKTVFTLTGYQTVKSIFGQIGNSR